MHLAQRADQVIVGIFERIQVELEGRLLIPILKIEQLENVTNVVLLVQCLALKIREGFQNATDACQMLNKLLHEGLLTKLGELAGQA